MQAATPAIPGLYRDPLSREALREQGGRWFDPAGRELPVLQAHGFSVPLFTGIGEAASAHPSAGMYDAGNAAEVYRNFLNWLYATFHEDERAFRLGLIARLRLQAGQRLLFTGCGLGDDIFPVLETTGCEVYASDLSPTMVAGAARDLSALPAEQRGRVFLSVSDACRLPFDDGSFDAAYHFGGINLFDDPRQGIAEMTRVVREGGRVVFGDEGVAPWLRGTPYGRMVVANNPLWDADHLAALLPFSAVNVNLAWVLGNCFYLIDYDKRSAGPVIDPDVPHLGWKGGSMRTRYEGRIEGIGGALKARLHAHAQASGTSVHDFVEAAIRERLDQAGAARTQGDPQGSAGS